jgi:hypothetical protein
MTRTKAQENEYALAVATVSLERLRIQIMRAFDLLERHQAGGIDAQTGEPISFEEVLRKIREPFGQIPECPPDVFEASRDLVTQYRRAEAKGGDRVGS